MSKYLPFDKLLSHQPLFNIDVTTADIESDLPLTLKTKRNVLFQKVRLNGIIVARQDNDDNNETRCILYLDDTSGIIQVHISHRIYNRKYSEQLTMGNSITIIGEPRQYNKIIIIQCQGFRIEHDPISEIRHALTVIHHHREKSLTKIHDSSTGQSSCYLSNGRKKQRSESTLFNSLSSQPSPIRASIENLYPSPLRDNTRDNSGPVINDSQASKGAPWHWSPDHIGATSTPIRPSPKSTLFSPLRLAQKINQRSPLKINNHALDDDDDDFGFDSQFDVIDFDDIEKKALDAKAAIFK